jgi:hypothetical protein
VRFRIDLLINDAPGVQLKAERQGFDMLLMAPTDEQWIVKVRTIATKNRARV